MEFWEERFNLRGGRIKVVRLELERVEGKRIEVIGFKRERFGLYFGE